MIQQFGMEMKIIFAYLKSFKHTIRANIDLIITNIEPVFKDNCEMILEYNLYDCRYFCPFVLHSVQNVDTKYIFGFT